MIAVIIVLGVLALIAVLLFLPLSVKFEFEQNAEIKIKYAFITVYNSEKKKKKPKKQKATEKDDTEKKDKQSFFTDEIERLGVKDFIVQYGKIALSVLSKLLWFIRKIKFDLLLFNLTVATDNAFDTAVQYGAVCAAVYPALSLICSNAKVKVKQINVSADFNTSSYGFSVKAKAACPLVFAELAIYKFIKIYHSIKNGQLEIKDGEKDE